MSSSSIPEHVTVNTDDLTLDELDRATKLTQDGSAGQTAALAFVFLKRDHPGVRLHDVKQLKQRQLTVTNDDELAAEQGAQGDDEGLATDPTN